MSCFRNTVFATAALLMLAGTSVSAQQLGVAYQIVAPTGKDLASGSGLRAWIGAGGNGLMLTISSLDGSRTDPRVMCSGLIPPGEVCEPESAVTRSKLRHYTLGYAFGKNTAAGRLSITPAAGISYAKSATIGSVTGRRFGGTTGSLMGSVAIQLSRALFRGHVEALAGGEVGSAGAIPDQCADCATLSHDDGYSFGSVFVGLSLKPWVR